MGTDRQQGLKFHNINKQVANCYYCSTFAWPGLFIIAEGPRFQVAGARLAPSSFSFTNYNLAVGRRARGDATETEL